MRRTSSPTPPLQFLALACVLAFAAAPAARAERLQVFLLLGQSNMEGQAYTYDNANTANWNIPTMEFLLSGTPAAASYRANLPFDFEGSLEEAWLEPREDVWCVHYDSANGATKDVLPTRDPADIVNGVAPLGPGFGVGTNFGSMFGPELAMGIRLGDALESPVFLFKADKGGTTLGNDWRPPTAVEKRGGATGSHFTRSMERFIAFLDELDADLAADGELDDYGGADGYTVAGVFWFQGWNEQFEDGIYTAAQLQADYRENLKDLIYSIRAADPRLPGDLGLIIGESSDQDPDLTAARIAAVGDLNAEVPGSAVFFDSADTKGVDWGNNESGEPFSQGWGFHFHARAENFLEIGWKAAGAALGAGFVTEGPLELSFARVADLAFDRAEVAADINEDADRAVIVWGTADRGRASPDDWPNALELGFTPGRGEVTAVLPELAEDTEYVFRFFARSETLGAEAWSGLGTFVTPFENPPPRLGAPTNTLPNSDGAEVSCELDRADATAVHVVWAFDDQGESDLAAWEGAPGGGSADLGPAGVGQVVSAEIDGLEPGTEYVVRFFAQNTFGSVWSRALSLRTARLDGVAQLTAFYTFEGSAEEALRDHPGAGSFADDLTGFNATFTADVPAGARGSAQAASFDGNTALFTGAFTNDLVPDPNAYTIMFWIKGADAEQENNNTRLLTSRVRPDGSNTDIQRWQVEGFGNNGSNGGRMDVRLQSADLPAIWFQPDAAGALANAGEEPAWHHVAFVLSNAGHPDDGGAYGITYVDGLQAGATLNPNPGFDFLDIGNQDGQLVIGGNSVRAGTRAFTGLLDDVALFAGVVGADDIAAIAAGTLSPADLNAAGPADDIILRVEPAAGGADLRFTWNSRAGKAYTLRANGDLAAPPVTWPPAAAGILATPPANTLTLPRPAAPEMFYLVEEHAPAAP